MKVTVDTNILIRAVMRDDPKQAATAAKLLKNAETIAVPLPCLCEFVRVLRRVYRLGAKEIHAALQALLKAGNVAVNRPAVEAGLAVLVAGGDFADGLIAFEGQWLGGETFLIFRQEGGFPDRKAGSAGTGSNLTPERYSTVTDFARLRGWSISVPFSTATL